MISEGDANSILEEHFSEWVRDLHIEVSEITSEHCITHIPLTEKLARHGGIVSGQALMAMADTTMVLATAGAFGEFKPVATTNFNCQFLRPGVGDHVQCRAEIIRAGKSLAYVEAYLTSLPSAKPIARAQATFFVP